MQAISSNAGSLQVRVRQMVLFFKYLSNTTNFLIHIRVMMELLFICSDAGSPKIGKNLWRLKMSALWYPDEDIHVILCYDYM